MKMRESVSFEISISAKDDGTIEAIYISLGTGGKVAKTEEIDEDSLLADYDSNGVLIGLEILAPVRINDLAKLVDKSIRPSFRKFVRHAAPQEFVLCKEPRPM
jgi:uncharacterized protein YuzE